MAVTVVGGGDLGVEEGGHGFGIWWKLIRDMIEENYWQCMRMRSLRAGCWCCPVIQHGPLLYDDVAFVIFQY